MLDIAVLGLIICLWYSVFLQPDNTRTSVAILFVLPLMLHDLAFHVAFDSISAYYISAGMIDLCVILAISKMAKYCRLSGDVQVISLVSIVYNFIGWLMFNFGAQVEAYNVMYLFLYGWTLFVLNRGEPKHGIYGVDTRLFAVHANDSARRVIHYNH